MIFVCLAAIALDGDTLACAPNAEGIEIRVRLAGIDAPELPGHCRRGRVCAPGDPYAAREALRLIAVGKTLTCTATGKTWNRIAAWCEEGGSPLSCAMLATGQVVRWESYWPKGRRCS